MNLIGIPAWVSKLPLDEITAEAEEHNIPWQLLAAVVSVESNGDPWAVRYEARWSYLFSPREMAEKLHISAETETQLQKCSWGLGQVMGSVARELGWQGPLPMLCEVQLGLHFSALKLEQLWRKYGLESDVAAAYNGGGAVKELTGMYRNQQYVDKVDRRLRDLRQLKQ